MNLLDRGGLSLERMRNFLAVADAGSISKAADRDPGRQSLMSRQIRELEEFFGTELTRRHGKGIVITDEGRRLAALVRESLGGLEDFAADARGRRKTFAIGAGGSVIEWLLCPVAKGICDALGGASVRFEALRTLDLVERVREGKLDFAVVRADALPSGAESAKVGEIGYALCVPKRLRKKPVRKLSDLSEIPLALPWGGRGFHRALSGYFEENGFRWEPSAEYTSFLQALALVESGDFAAFLPEIGAARLPAGKFTVKPAPALKSRRLVLHWNRRQMAMRDVGESVIDAVCGAVRLTLGC